MLENDAVVIVVNHIHLQMELSDLRPGKRERTRRFKILLHRYTRETWRETERFGGMHYSTFCMLRPRAFKREIFQVWEDQWASGCLVQISPVWQTEPDISTSMRKLEEPGEDGVGVDTLFPESKTSWIGLR